MASREASYSRWLAATARSSEELSLKPRRRVKCHRCGVALRPRHGRCQARVYLAATSREISNVPLVTGLGPAFTREVSASHWRKTGCSDRFAAIVDFRRMRSHRPAFIERSRIVADSVAGRSAAPIEPPIPLIQVVGKLDFILRSAIHA